MSLGAAKAALLGAAGAGGSAAWDYSAATWDTAGSFRTNFSNGDLTGTSSLAAAGSKTKSNLSIGGSTYVEITAIDSGFLVQPGLTPDSSSLALAGDELPVNSVTYNAGLHIPETVFGISYDPATGGYAIRESDVLVASGTVPDNTEIRIFISGGDSDSTDPLIATINTGATPFVYTPTIL